MIDTFHNCYTRAAFDMLANKNGKYVISGEGTFYYKNDIIHRDDGPAIEKMSGKKEWWLNGKLSRLDGPAIEDYDGSVEYWIDAHYYDKEEYDYVLSEYKSCNLDEFGEIKSAHMSGCDRGEYVKYFINDMPCSYAQFQKAYGIYCAEILKQYNDRKNNSVKKQYLNAGEYQLIKPKDRNGIYIIKDYGICYYKDGEHHRQDGPSQIRLDGSKHWFTNNQRHRIDGPAVEYSDGSAEYWINDGRYSRESYEKAVKDYNKNSKSTIKKGNSKMNITNDLKRSGARVITKKISAGAKDALVAILEGYSGDELKTISKFLDSQIGTALVQGSIGLSMDKLPLPDYIKDNEYYQLAAEECRTGAITTTMELALEKGEIIGQSLILPIVEALAKLPGMKNDETLGKVRIMAQEGNVINIADAFSKQVDEDEIDEKQLAPTKAKASLK